MTVRKTEKGTKKFTPAEKLAIIKEAELKVWKITLA